MDERYEKGIFQDAHINGGYGKVGLQLGGLRYRDTRAAFSGDYI